MGRIGNPLDLITAGPLHYTQHVPMALVSLSSLSSPPSSSSRLQLHRPISLSPHRIAASSASAFDSATDSLSPPSTSNLTPKVVVTRERGKNVKLIAALVCILFISPSSLSLYHESLFSSLFCFTV